jgi:hypothetical protein
MSSNAYDDCLKPDAFVMDVQKSSCQNLETDA